MPFKGFHGHTRHTHEDKVREERKKERVDPPKNPKQEQSAVLDEMDLYNSPFTPFTPQNTAHYVNRFFRRTAQTVVHCLLALSPHFYIHTDELFDWMMPYERMGALLSEDAEDYINREKARLKMCKNGEASESEADEPEAENEINEEHGDNGCSNHLSQSISSPNTSLASSDLTSHVSTHPSISSSSTNPYGLASPNANLQGLSSSSNMYDFSSPSNLHTVSQFPTTHASNESYVPPEPPTAVSSIFSSDAKNPHTDHEVQVDPKDPGTVVHPSVNHFHPPFLIIDCRREDEYVESHIHGAVHIHYIPPKGPQGVIPGERLHFELPKWVEYDTPIITYCAVGLRSGLMVWELRRRGYKFVKVLSGGYYKWVNEGRPIYAHTGELTQKVLQQHKIAGIMLRKELKAEQKRERKNAKHKEIQDTRVAVHHESDIDFPPCHHYRPCPEASLRDKQEKKEKEKKEKEARKSDKRRASIVDAERKNSWLARHSESNIHTMDTGREKEKDQKGLSRRRKSVERIKMESEKIRDRERDESSWLQRHSLGSSAM